jgi:hypothetical protein
MMNYGCAKVKIVLILKQQGTESLMIFLPILSSQICLYIGVTELQHAYKQHRSYSVCEKSEGKYMTFSGMVCYGYRISTHLTAALEIHTHSLF